MYKFFLRRKIKKILNQSDRKKVYHNLKEIKTILVLFDTKDYEDVAYFVQQVKKMGKKVKAIAYKEKKDTQDYPKNLFNVVTSKEMKNVKGEALTQIIHSLGENTFDLVVDLTLEENLLLQYILVSISSPFRVGFYKTNPPIHDMVISISQEQETSKIASVKELGKQLIYYLTVISSKTT
jgi:ADP-heptose:LPS heptosyltransferase